MKMCSFRAFFCLSATSRWESMCLMITLSPQLVLLIPLMNISPISTCTFSTSRYNLSSSLIESRWCLPSRKSTDRLRSWHMIEEWLSLWLWYKLKATLQTWLYRCSTTLVSWTAFSSTGNSFLTLLCSKSYSKASFRVSRQSKSSQICYSPTNKLVSRILLWKQQWLCSKERDCARMSEHLTFT